MVPTLLTPFGHLMNSLQKWLRCVICNLWTYGKIQSIWCHLWKIVSHIICTPFCSNHLTSTLQKWCASYSRSAACLLHADWFNYCNHGATYPLCCLALNLQETSSWIIQRCGSQCRRIRNCREKRYKVFIHTPQALNLLPVYGPGNHWWTLLYNETHCRVAVIWCAFKQPASPHIFILILIKQKTINMIHAHCNKWRFS